MGAWGANAFENDDAADWLSDLVDTEDDTDPVRFALEAVIEEDEPVEAPESSMALAAAEVVAAALGRPSPKLPEDVQSWLPRQRVKVIGELRDLALDAVRTVKENSELRDLWNESDPAEWLKEVEDLEKRLRGSAKSKGDA